LPLLPPGRPPGQGRWHPPPPHKPCRRGAARGKRVKSPPWPEPTHARARVGRSACEPTRPSSRPIRHA
jgi:hypothetical protein